MSKSPWGTIGAWAAEAEREEAEEAAALAAAPPPQTTYPSLKESVTQASNKQKKKTKMSLLEFTMQQSSSSSSRGLTHEEMLRLPTRPKERSDDEIINAPRGFSNYGSRPGKDGSSSIGRERRSYGFDDDNINNYNNNRRGGGGGSGSRDIEFDMPSRADGVDNWKRQTVVPEYNSSREIRPNVVGSKYTSLGTGARADDVDNWASLKKPVMQPVRSSGFGSGFSRQEYSRPDSERWVKNEEVPKVEGVKVNKPNPFGAARPREEVLSEKGLDWKKLDLEIEAKTVISRPGSSHSSRPTSAHSNREEVDGVKQKVKVNPFGDAKPREVLLEQKGLDWKKLDLEMDQRHGVERPETEEEKALKEEIEHLKKEALQISGEDQTKTNDLLLQKERDLELLTRQLDDKVRYSQKVFDRPSSGHGRGDRPPSRSGPYDHQDSKGGFHDRRPGSYEEPRASYTERGPSRPGAYEDSRGGFPERPFSRPGAYEEPRGGAYPQRSSTFTRGTYQEPRALDYNERPRSRGSERGFSGGRDDRRAFHGGGGRGFSGGRDVDRSASRW